MKKRTMILAALMVGVLAASVSLSACGNQNSTDTPATSDSAEPASDTSAANTDTEAEPSDAQTDGAVNSWVETTAEEIMQVLGLELAVPEAAEEVVYRMNEALQMEEMSFILDGNPYVARMMPTGSLEIEDISGMYYDWGEPEEDEVAGLPAEILFGEEDGIQYEVINWLDIVPGISYSLATYGEDLDGLDIAVIAGQVYEQMQGED